MGKGENNVNQMNHTVEPNLDLYIYIFKLKSPTPHYFLLKTQEYSTVHFSLFVYYLNTFSSVKIQKESKVFKQKVSILNKWCFNSFNLSVNPEKKVSLKYKAT